MKITNMLDFYRAILKLGNLSVDSQNKIQAMVNDSAIPTLVNDRRLALPTTELLASVDNVNCEFFHPLSEHVLRGESAVLAKFRHCINTRLNFVLMGMSSGLLELVGSVAMHSKLKPEQSEILSAIKNVNADTVTKWSSIMKAMGLGNPEKCFVHIFLKRKAQINGKEYARAAIVTFPLYQELCGEGDKVFGVKVSKKERTAFKQLLEFMIKDVHVPHAYDVGSQSDIAPFLVALLNAVAQIALDNINPLIEMYGDVIEELKQWHYDDEWLDALSNLPSMMAEIRSVSVGRGDSPAAPTQPKPAAPASSIASMTFGKTQALQAPAPAPAQVAPGKASMDNFMREHPELARPAGFGSFGVPEKQRDLHAGTPRWASASSGTFNPKPSSGFGGFGRGRF